jgi:TatD DNase family protein
MLIDTHCHLDDRRFDYERQKTIARAREIGVSRFITIGCDIANSIRAMSISIVHPDVYFSSGIHPHEAAKAPQNFMEQLRIVASHHKCVAIGECGLDYYHNHSPKEAQQRVFKNQIQLAHELKKPLVIHVRDAWEDCLSILEEYKQLRTKTVIHCFTGTLAQAKMMVDLGCVLSISGVVTFKEPGELHKVVTQIPLDHLLVETDSPYLAPVPYRGKRNEPAFVFFVAQKIAELRGILVDEVILQTGKNAQSIFGIN